MFFSNHLNLSTKSRIPLNGGALNPGLSVLEMTQIIANTQIKEGDQKFLIFMYMTHVKNIYTDKPRFSAPLFSGILDLVDKFK